MTVRSHKWSGDSIRHFLLCGLGYVVGAAVKAAFLHDDFHRLFSFGQSHDHLVAPEMRLAPQPVVSPVRATGSPSQMNFDDPDIIGVTP